MDIKNMSLLTGVFLTLTSLSLQNHENTSGFQEFKEKYGKSYDSEVEETYRQVIFDSNVEKVIKHNDDYTQTYKIGINHFSDMTNEEFEKIVLMPKREMIIDTELEIFYDEDFEEEINWVTKGAVTTVKDQGYCGSCWAFSAAGAVESFKFTEEGELGDFSVQQLVSCDRLSGNFGCYGGLEYRAMTYYAENGICTAKTYPYHSGCGFSKKCEEYLCTKDSFTISGYESVIGEQNLLAAIKIGPTSVAVDACNMKDYESGIYNNCNHNLNHAVLLVGYTSEYWLIKNSWSHFWGEDGYIRLSSGNTCGIADDASRPIQSQ